MDITIIFILDENEVSVYKVLDTTSSLHFRWIVNNFIATFSTKIHLLLSCKEVTFSSKKYLHWVQQEKNELKFNEIIKQVFEHSIRYLYSRTY